MSSSLSASRWPARQWICLDCRTTSTDSQCAASAAHAMAPLGEPDGREPLLARVWGPPELRRQIREAAGAGAIGGAATGLADGCSGCASFAPADIEILPVVLIGVAIFVVWTIVAAVWTAVGAWRARPRPRGATDSARPPRASRATGVVLTPTPGGPLAIDPLTEVACVAFATQVRYRHRWWSAPEPMLRDAATVGFEIRLDTGETVRIPAGSFVADIGRARAPRDDRARIESYLDMLDPGRAVGDDLDPFPWSFVRHVAIQPGDRVELRARLVPVVDASRAGSLGLYRESPATFLVPDGPVQLRALDDSARK